MILKEFILLSSVNLFFFRIVLVAIFMLSLVVWVVVFFDYGMVLLDLNIGLFYLFVIFLLGVYGIIIVGWFSN